MINILFLGEIIGIPTIKFLYKNLENIKKEYNIHFVIANADGASDGYGLLKTSAVQLHKSGVDIITTGDYVFNKKDVKDLLKLPFLTRPYNLPNSLGGKGIIITEVNNVKIGIMNLIGRINFTKVFPMDPFYSATKMLEKIDPSVKIIILDFHGGTTSEVQAMHWYLAGKVTAVIGSHLRVLTSDARILNGKTAVITGTGFCGICNSIGGLRADIEINKIKTGIFNYSKIDCEPPFILQGALLKIDEEKGVAISIENFKKEIAN